MQGSKIRLSPTEMKLFGNAEIILTKNSILQKTVALLGEVQEALVKEDATVSRHPSPPPKISKGENYLGMPYVILDYPRIANGGDLFFIRSMFWWGHFFSSTLQVSGNYAVKFREGFTNVQELLRQRNYYVGLNRDPWQHHFKEDNFKRLASFSAEELRAITEELPHIKIAASWPLSEWDSAASKLIESWRLLMNLTNLV